MLTSKWLYFITILVAGGYSNWSQWSQCSKTCGVGEKTRNRSCTNPSPANGGSTCIAQNFGDASETSACNEGDCPSKWTLSYIRK